MTQTRTALCPDRLNFALSERDPMKQVLSTLVIAASAAVLVHSSAVAQAPEADDLEVIDKILKSAERRIADWN